MGIFNFSSLKDTILGVKNRLADLDKEISTLSSQCALLVSLPLPYDDFVDWALGRYDFLGEGYPTEVKRELLSRDTAMRTFYMQPRTGHESLADFQAVFSNSCPVSFERPLIAMGNYSTMTERAFFFVFKDVIKDAMRRMFDEVIKPEWPKAVGLARAERIPQIEKLEKRLTDLTSERDQIREELSAATA